ncbi:MAG: hypothetical protein SVV03_02595 [Candidatus Nanohaloarchaea archaeon]|nr:hypothetical protein [Candidatus Nanohaloarchaea archaeon]
MASFSVSQKTREKHEPEVVQKGSGTDFEDIDFVQKLADAIGVLRSEAEEQVRKVKDEYQGLVTLDSSAAILAARNHGEEILDDPEMDTELEIANVVPGMSSIDIRATVVKIMSENTFDGGRVRSCDIEDSSGKTQLTFWNEDCDALDHLSRGDNIKVVNAYTKEEVSDWQQKHYDSIPAIQLGDDAKVIAMKEGEEVEVVEAE